MIWKKIVNLEKELEIWKRNCKFGQKKWKFGKKLEI